MGNVRKTISKKIRFEVFKRDKFTCQYCGRSVPDVILHVDHIKPVSKGGTNDIMNLITSCQDCNLGKGARELSDDSIVKKQQRQIQELADKNEQLEMLLKWKESLLDFNNSQVDKVNEYIGQYSEWIANDNGKKTIKKWLRDFPMEIILESIDIAFEQYYEGTRYSWSTAFNKVGGICRNKMCGDKEGNKSYYYNYLAKACKNKYGCWTSEYLHFYVEKFIDSDEEFEKVKSMLKYSRYWGDFKYAIEGEYGDYGDI